MIKIILIVLTISTILIYTYIRIYKSKLPNLHKELLLIVVCIIGFILWILGLAYLPQLKE